MQAAPPDQTARDQCHPAARGPLDGVRVLDLSLFDSIHFIRGPEAANYQLRGVPTLRNGSRASNTAPRVPCAPLTVPQPTP